MPRTPSQLNACRIGVVIVAASVAQYLLLSLALFANTYPAPYQAAVHILEFPAPPTLPPYVEDSYACRICSPLRVLDTHAFSCESCNITTPPPPDLDPDSKEAQIIRGTLRRAVRELRRSTIDCYYDEATWFMSSRHCSLADDLSKCPTGVLIALLSNVLDVPEIRVHPVSVICALLLIAVTLLEVGYVQHLIKSEARRRDDVIVAAIQRATSGPGVEVDSDADSDADAMQREHAKMAVDSLLNDSGNLFGIAKQRRLAQLQS